MLQLVRNVPANVAFSVLCSAIARNLKVGADTVSALMERTGEKLYLSGLSAHLALWFMRLSSRPNFRPLDPVMPRVLEYFLSPSEFLNLRPDIATGILDVVQRVRHRDLLTGFCESIAEELKSRETEGRHWFPARIALPFHDSTFSESIILAISILDVFSKFGSRSAKDLLYKYALQRWFRPGRWKLISSVIKYARETDGGSMLLDFVKAEAYSVRTNLRRSGKVSITGLIPRTEFSKLPIQAVLDLGWFAVQIGDIESMRAVSDLVKSTLGSFES
jgi:hypothetical protein